MTQAAYPIPRANPRSALTGFLPGPLASKRCEDLTVVLVDICTSGLGLVVHPDVREGETLTLQWSMASGLPVLLSFQVVWCASIPTFARIRGMDGAMRIGLKIQDPSLDLKALFKSCETLHIEE